MSATRTFGLEDAKKLKDCAAKEGSDAHDYSRQNGPTQRLDGEALFGEAIDAEDVGTKKATQPGHKKQQSTVYNQRNEAKSKQV